MAIHPGEHLAEELEMLKMSAADLAPRLSVAKIRSRQGSGTYATVEVIDSGLPLR